MQVNKGAPNAEDLNDDDSFIWASINNRWVLCEVCGKRLWDVQKELKYDVACEIRLNDIIKWAHCEGPVESAEL